LSPARPAAPDATNHGSAALPATRGQVHARSADAATTREFFLGVDGHLLDFGERVARDLASADVSASLTRVFALERAQHELAREASVYIAVLASGTPKDFSEWVGAQTSGTHYRELFTNTATDGGLGAYQSAMGDAKAPAALP